MPRYLKQMDFRGVLSKLEPGMSALLPPGDHSIIGARARLSTLAKELKLPIDIKLATIAVEGEPTEKMIQVTRRKA